MSNVAICPVKRSDAADLIKANIASREHHTPWLKPFTDMEGFDDWFGQTLTGPNLGIVARHRDSGDIVGVLNLSQIVWGLFRSSYLGYYGMVGHERKGLMTEALRLTSKYAFDEIGLHRLEANIQPLNSASIRLARRVGFEKEGFSPCYLKIGGVWCDHERWTLLSAQG